jgi:hypothetical protein
MISIKLRRQAALLPSLAFAMFGLFVPGDSRADVITHFSQFSSDTTSPEDLTASVQYSISGSDLDITINNPSNYKIGQLYFNADSALSELSFDMSSYPNPAWSITGGASQTQGADGFGRYNWLIDFGSGANRLGPGVTNLSLNMFGDTSEGTIATKLSTVPPGSIQAISAMKFEAGPEGDSAFGSARPTQVMLRDIQSFTGTATSVPFSVNGYDLETGKIVLALDPSAHNFFGLDAELHQGFIDATLILSLPEFPFPELLGPDPIRIRILESGPVSIYPWDGGGGFDFTALLTGGGTIHEGIFAGVTFSNVNRYEGDGSFGSLIVNATPISWSLDHSGTVMFPPSLGGMTQSIDGTGWLNVVPEPGGISLAAISFVALLATARPRRRRLIA